MSGTIPSSLAKLRKLEALWMGKLETQSKRLLNMKCISHLIFRRQKKIIGLQVPYLLSLEI